MQKFRFKRSYEIFGLIERVEVLVTQAPLLSQIIINHNCNHVGSGLPANNRRPVDAPSDKARYDQLNCQLHFSMLFPSYPGHNRHDLATSERPTWLFDLVPDLLSPVTLPES